VYGIYNVLNEDPPSASFSNLSEALANYLSLIHQGIDGGATFKLATMLGSRIEVGKWMPVTFCPKHPKVNGNMIIKMKVKSDYLVRSIT